MWIDEFGHDLGQFGFYYILPHYKGKGRVWYRTKGRAKGKALIQQPGQPEPQGMRAPPPGIPMYAPNRRGQIRAVLRSSDGRLVAFSSSGSEEEPAEGGSSNDEGPAGVAEQAEEESVAVAEEEPDSDDFSPWPPLPREQVGRLTHERCTQTLTVYPRNAGTIPGAHGPILDPNGYPEALHEVRVPWNIFRHRFKFEVRRYSHKNIMFIVWRRDLHQVTQEATLAHSLSEEGYNVLLDDWLIPIWLYYALIEELRRTVGPPSPDTSDSGSDAAEEWTNPENALTSDAMCPNMRISPSALRYDCDAYCSHTSGELYQRMSRNQHRSLYGQGFLMVFSPTSDQEPFALLGGSLNSGESASSSSGNVNPVPVLPFPMSKGKGKDATYLTPPWYAHHFGQSDQPAEEELAPDDNVLTLPQQSFELPNDVVHSQRYVIGKGKGGPIVKGKPAYTLEFRSDKGKGRQVQPPGTHSSDEDDHAPDGWHEWRRQQEAIHAALGYPAGEDDGAGVGDLGDDEIRHWREPDPDEMFRPRTRVPGDTPPSRGF